MRRFHCVAFGLAVVLVRVTPQISKADKVRFGHETYAVEQLVVVKSSSARLARFEDGNPEMLKKHIYLPTGTPLYLLDRSVRDWRIFNWRCRNLACRSMCWGEIQTISPQIVWEFADGGCGFATGKCSRANTALR